MTDHFERQLAAGVISASDPRLRNRRLLYWAVRAENFENDPAVFWHYDWGDQLYVQLTRALRPDPANAAWYGYVSPP